MRRTKIVCAIGPSRDSPQMLETGLPRNGDRVVITAGIPMGVPGSRNSTRVATI